MFVNAVPPLDGASTPLVGGMASRFCLKELPSPPPEQQLAPSDPTPQLLPFNNMSLITFAAHVPQSEFSSTTLQTPQPSSDGDLPLGVGPGDHIVADRGELLLGLRDSFSNKSATELACARLLSLRRRQSLHVQPYGSDLWEEEENRRTRFALEDSIDTSPPTLKAPSSLATLRQRPSRAISFSRSAHSRWHTHYLVEPSSLHVQTPTAAYLVDSSIHPDALPVDDPRRTYDFCDFLDRWRPKSPQRGFGVLDQWPAVPTWPIHGDVIRDPSHNTTTDLQGIQWDTIDTTRVQAQDARSLLHPSNAVTLGASYARKMFSTPGTEEEIYYRFRSFVPKPEVPQLSHDQLRNGLAANNRADLFYAADSKIIRSSLVCPSYDRTIVDFVQHRFPSERFQITNISLSPSDHPDSVLLAGDNDGELALLDLHSAQSRPFFQAFQSSSPHNFVTHTHIFPTRQSDSLTASICFNDSTVRLLDLSRFSQIQTHVYPHAINCAATSPDGRLRALVGDSPYVILADADKGEIIHTLSAHSQDGFACAWSHDGRLLATGAEDGWTMIWDARNFGQPMARLSSRMSCPRSLVWIEPCEGSRGGSLVVGEGEDVVSVFDGQALTQGDQGGSMRQDIRFFGCVAGVGVLDGGDELVVANGDRNFGGLLSFSRRRGRGTTWLWDDDELSV